MRNTVSELLTRRLLVLTVVSSGLFCACEGGLEPVAPGGGREVSLDAVFFMESIELILQRRGCSNVACHGGQGSGELILSGGLDPQGDLIAVTGLVTTWRPQDSALLRKPLAETAGGVQHGGGDVFADTGDVDYQTVLNWIAGEVSP